MDRLIIIIDDNPADCNVFKRFLQRDKEHHYAFVQASTGEEGLILYRALAPDCILIDYDLPDMTGLELLTEILTENECPVVMMTGSGDETVAVQAIQAGAQNYLVKGNITADGLLIAVNNAIEKVQLRQSVEAQKRNLWQQNVELHQRQEEIQSLNYRLQRSMTEAHHRIKNNLQTLVAIVNLYTQGDEETVPLSTLQRLGAHMQMLASLHDLLTQQTKIDSENNTIGLKVLLDKLVPMIQATAGLRQIHSDTQEVELSVKQANVFLLLTNELLSNGLKHGKGDVWLSLNVEGNEGHLVVEDDGPGFPLGFDVHQSAKTGLELIDSITQYDLKGSILFENPPQGGARVVVTFPLTFSEPPAPGLP